MVRKQQCYYADIYSQVNSLFFHAGAPVSLKTVLAFFTGADCIPPLGYTSATLTFNPTDPYPTASTCAIQLTLPTKYESFEEFKEHMNTALRMHGGFGLV